MQNSVIFAKYIHFKITSSQKNNFMIPLSQSWLCFCQSMQVILLTYCSPCLPQDKAWLSDKQPYLTDIAQLVCLLLSDSVQRLALGSIPHSNYSGSHQSEAPPPLIWVLLNPLILTQLPKAAWQFWWNFASKSKNRKIFDGEEMFIRT